ncbi:MAG: S8 family serine peptidase [Actinomycetota bacterium]
MRESKRTFRLKAAIPLLVLVMVFGPAAGGSSRADAGGGLLGGLLGGLVGVVDGLLGVVTAGWDDGATTDPTPMRDVTAATGAQQMWSRGYDGRGVDVALIDSGVAPVQGLSAASKVLNGPDLSFESQSRYYRHLDTFGHGTHMAGIISGTDGTSGGFKGMAPGSRLVNLKVASRDGAADVSQVIAAIDWVVQHRHDGLNIRVLNLSFGTNGVQDRMVDPLAHAVESAWRNGIVVVVAGGNDGATRSALSNPAYDPMVLAVGAVDLKGTVSAVDDRVAPFSSRGSVTRSVDLVAPGVSIASLRNPGSSIDDAHQSSVVNTRFFRGSGTSQAAAVTSGAVALLLQARPDLTPDQVKALLRSTATPLAQDGARAQGSGRLNVDLAARSAVPSNASQASAPSQGTGLLEAARGSDHVAEAGVELTGERDIMGAPWVGSAWAPLASIGAAWDGGYWRGVEWTGSCWCSTSWSGTSWSGKSWTGKSWTGKSWTSDLWSGKSWTGKSWTGTSWTGKSWTGTSWTGRNWMLAARSGR